MGTLAYLLTTVILIIIFLLIVDYVNLEERTRMMIELRKKEKKTTLENIKKITGKTENAL